MVEIKDLLSKFSKLFNSLGMKNDLIAETISSISKINVKKEEIEVKSGTIYLNIKPIYKNEIFKKKEEILSILKSTIDKNPPTDIR